MFSNMPRAHYDDVLAAHQEGLLDIIQRAGISVLWNEEQHVVVTLTINTHAGQVQAGHVLMRNAIAGPFTAPIVLIPQHADPGALNNIQQSLLMGGQHII